MNGSPVAVPYSTANYQVFYYGAYLRYETTFGLYVEFDGKWTGIVSVPSTYSGQMTGMCGNYDGKPNNDLTLTNGSYVGLSGVGWIAFGDSWIVPDTEQADTSSVHNARLFIFLHSEPSVRIWLF